MGANTHANIEGIYQRLPLIAQALPEGAALQLYYHQAVLIMINVPLALIGGIIALWLSEQYLSVPGSIGFIALFGVAVLNGVVMVTSINQRITNTNNVEKAILEGANSRLRPVLMTALTGAFGLVPLLLATGVGSEIQRPLATVVIGGLVSSTLLTLLVIPALYFWFSRGWLRNNLREE